MTRLTGGSPRATVLIGEIGENGVPAGVVAGPGRAWDAARYVEALWA